MARGATPRPLPPAIGDRQVRNTRGDRLLDDPVDRRTIDDGQHPLGLLLREAEEARTGAGGGDDGSHDTGLSLSALPPILAAASRFHPLIP